MKRALLALTLALTLALSSSGQATVFLTSTHLADSGLNPVTGQVTITPSLCSSASLPGYHIGGFGLALASPIHAYAVAGVFSITVPDTTATNPPNIGFNITSGPAIKPTLNLSCVQPGAGAYWCSTESGVTTCNLDNYIPLIAPVPTVAYVQSINGCTGVCMVAGGSGSVTSVFGRTGAVVAASGDYAGIYDVYGAATGAQSGAEGYTNTQIAALGLGTASTKAISYFDLAGAAATAQTAAEAASDSSGSAASVLSAAETFAANSSNQSGGTLPAARLPSQYRTWGASDGAVSTSALPTSGFPAVVFGANESGATQTITAVTCFVDGGTGTVFTLVDNSGNNLLGTTASCSTSGASTTVSGSHYTLASAGYMKYTLTPDGTAKTVTIVVSGTY